MATVRRKAADLQTASLPLDQTPMRSSTIKAPTMRKAQRRRHGSYWYVFFFLEALWSGANNLQFWLCGPCAFLSGAIALWTIFALLISLALAPLRFCTKRPSLSEQITAFLAPALNLQLHLVYSHDSTTGYSAPMLVVIHLFSPVVAFGVAIAAWTAAGFWFFSLILGDPGGHDGHNDGKESIVGVRNWWERWLSRGLRETNV
jgi:hypothetical protein